MIGLEIQANFAGLDKFTKNLLLALDVGLQTATTEVELIAIEEVLVQDAYDTYALMESIYTSTFGASTYDQKVAMATDALENNPTKWPAIRNARQGTVPFLEVDPQVVSDSRYDAWVAVAASHGKYVENGYISWYKNWVPARPFWQATVDRAVPVVLQILNDAVNAAIP